MTIANNYPLVRPSLSLDFANTKALDPRITFGRASNNVGSYYDANTTALAEQNLLTYSQVFSNAAWQVGQTTIGSLVNAPDGNTTATTITATAINNLHYIGSIPTGSAYGAANNTYTFSTFIQAGTNTFVSLNCGNGANNYAVATFNLSAPSSATKTASAGNMTYISSSISQVGSSSWYRVTLTFSTGSTAGVFVNICLNTSATPTYGIYGIETFLASGTESIYIWGAQLEQRSSVTAYNATTTTAITNYIPVLQTAPANQARFDHNPVTRESLGLLIEQQSTNLLTYSSDLSNAAWTKTNTTITTTANIAPDGTQTAQLIQVTTTNGFHSCDRATALTVGTQYTITCYAKAFGTRYLTINNSGVGTYGAGFDLISGTSTSGANATSSITSVGNGWYRCVVTFTAAYVYLAFYLNNTYTTSGISYAGDGYSGIYIWGAQLEATAFPTSYIPTVASQVTRSADSASMTGTNFSNWYNQSQGSFYAEGQFFKVGGAAVSFQVDDTTTNNRIVLAAFSSFAIVKSGTILANISSGATNINTNYKSASSYITNSATLSRNGATVVTGTPTSLPSVTRLVIGNDDQASNHLNGWIKKFAYYPATLTATNLQALTGS